jgi:hypothetical protein
MKISDLFTVISKSSDFGDVSKQELFKAVRSIIKVRKDLGMRNNIIDLYVNACDIQDYLADDLESIDVYLNIIFDLPAVQAYLKSKDIAFIDDADSDDDADDSDDSDDDDDDDDDDDSDDDDDDSSTDSDTPTPAQLPDKITINVQMPNSWMFSGLILLTVTNLCLTAVNTFYHYNAQ